MVDGLQLQKQEPCVCSQTRHTPLSPVATKMEQLSVIEEAVIRYCSKGLQPPACNATCTDATVSITAQQQLLLLFRASL